MTIHSALQSRSCLANSSGVASGCTVVTDAPARVAAKNATGKATVLGLCSASTSPLPTPRSASAAAIRRWNVSSWA